MFKPLDSIPGLELFTVGSGKYEVKNLEGPITFALLARLSKPAGSV